MKIKIGRRALSALPAVTRPTVFYDIDLTGFGLKASPTGALSYIVEYRPGAGGRSVSKRRMVIGTPKNLTPEEARGHASGILARVRLGDDPAAERSNARKAETVSELLTSFMDDHIRAKRKARTAKLFQGYVDNHIDPTLGTRKAPTLTRADIERLHKVIGKTHPVTANRVLALIGAAYAYGLRSGRLPERMSNPASGIERFRERVRERFLTEPELLRLGEAIREAETVGIPWIRQSKSKHARKAENRVTNIGPHAAGALRLLIFTGARLREILDLKWDHVDLQRGLLFLPDSKTGKKTIVLGMAALAVLENLPRVGKFAIAGTDNERPRADLQRPWALVSKRADLVGLRLHDLRHSFASVGAGSGFGLPVIGKLLGHSNSKTTERYAHLAADPLRRASDAISGSIAKAMGEPTPPQFD
ncbi:MAG: tyrosine-type recombinase/integrase [Bradyrhizobium sp.]|uniref:tyrosine-type recombinase/integrase n=1 Tax=Bradyrhizobium sp. TaxID=376 RepID=UPI002730150C|nr:tyrosine-type recombinase/integrase [Bradyrhizobium sp.]MDP1867088.1 tyrosine-type recombinase/integrase [Bradyrhizobium sp.]